MKFDFSLCGKELKECIGELYPITGIESGKDGKKVILNTDSSKMSIEVNKESIILSVQKKVQFFKMLPYVKKYGSQEKYVKNFSPSFERLTFMADLSRNACLNVEGAKQMIRCLALAGFDCFMLYLEDMFTVDSLPYFGYMRGRYSKEEIKQIDSYAIKFGIELMPCIQALSHLSNVLKWPCFNEITDCDDILLVGEEKTYDFLDKVFKSVSEMFSSKRINIGMDEAHLLGHGEYKKRHGQVAGIEIMRQHLARVDVLLKKYGFIPSMWSDMFFRAEYGDYYCPRKDIPETMKKSVPKDIKLIYWDYYHYKEEDYDDMISNHYQLTDNIAFAGAAYKWSGFAPIQRWSLSTSEPGLKSCIKNGIKDVILTTWGDNGAECSIFVVLPSLILYSQACYERSTDITGREEMFEMTYNCSYSDFLSLDLPNIMPENEDRIDTLTPNKYLVYNDPLLGLFDKNVVEDVYAEKYKNYAEFFRECEKRTHVFGYIFRTLSLLCEFLSEKCDLGIKIKKAYDKKDKAALENIAQVKIPKVIVLLEKWIRQFKIQWLKENKIFGFEVQEIRLGGQYSRLKSAIERIKDYIDGNIENIPELEEARLDFSCRENITDPNTYCDKWHLMASANNIANPHS